MMTNLFSIFDPSTSTLSLVWLILPISLLFTTTSMWKLNSPTTKITKKVILLFKKEVSYTLKESNASTELMVLILFVVILIMNFLAIFPQIFSLTSHLCITLPLSLIYWLSLMVFGWTKKTSHVLSHLVPQGTPMPLTSFMVIIEMVSNIIRPITLCVRLTANLIAGHLLMSLLGSALTSMNTMYIPILMPLPLILTMLESAVAFIQAYVFMTLITLYVTELK